MPCVRCARLQDDAGGWQVGVRSREQVLVCPECAGLVALEPCVACGSVKLKRQLGTTVCRACGWQSSEAEWSQ